MKNGWIEVKKEGTGKEAVVFLFRKAATVVDAAKEDLQKIVNGSAKMSKDFDHLLKRKWLVKK